MCGSAAGRGCRFDGYKLLSCSNISGTVDTFRRPFVPTSVPALCASVLDTIQEIDIFDLVEFMEFN